MVTGVRSIRKDLGLLHPLGGRTRRRRAATRAAVAETATQAPKLVHTDAGLLERHKLSLSGIVNSLELENSFNFLNLLPILVRHSVLEGFVSFQVFYDLLTALGFLVVL